MKTIALEQHFNVPEMMKRIPKQRIEERGWPSGDASSPSREQGNKLLPDVEKERLASMDGALRFFRNLMFQAVIGQ